MSSETKRFYEFGVFRIDAEKRVLLRDGQPVKLTPKVFDTLLVLVENSGSTLGKEELMKLLWPDSFVEESNLTENISNLREVLGERPRDNRYIMTVPKVGYRFVADVRKFSDEETDVVVSERTRSRITIRESEGETEQDLTTSSSAASLQDQSPTIETKLVKAETALPPAERANSGIKLHRSALFWAAVVIVLAATAFGVYKFLTRRSSLPFEKIRLTKLTTTGKIINAAVSPDGKNFAYVTADAGQESLWLRQLSASSNNVQIVAPAEAYYHGLTFSRDGSYIYYVLSEKFDPNALYRVPTLGGASIKLAEDVDGPVALSPDEKQLAYVRGYPDSH
ncbi:MAG TPA: winged helix-turn-helix domain-containing protein, partial [Pyrinomonadaceae bacterium]|nr:winged helix-turn-helix domain-containing protein [Pyrinomonadaceae bacterium]